MEDPALREGRAVFALSWWALPALDCARKRLPWEEHRVRRSSFHEHTFDGCEHAHAATPSPPNHSDECSVALRHIARAAPIRNAMRSRVGISVRCLPARRSRSARHLLHPGPEAGHEITVGNATYGEAEKALVP